MRESELNGVNAPRYIKEPKKETKKKIKKEKEGFQREIKEPTLIAFFLKRASSSSSSSSSLSLNLEGNGRLVNT